MKVLANSLPKSGTHLLVSMLELCGLKENSLSLKGSLVRPTQKNPFRNIYTRYCRTSKQYGFWVDLDDPKGFIRKRVLRKKFRSVNEGEFVVAHLPYSPELMDFFGGKDTRVIYITRDPRDVLVSYYNHQVRDSSYSFHSFFREKSLEESVEFILSGLSSGGVKLAPLIDRIANGLQWLDQDRVCHVRFEDLIGEKGGGDRYAQESIVMRILDFLDLSNSVDVEMVIENVYNTEAQTFHVGQINRWQREMSPKLVSRLNRDLGIYIEKLGYE